MATQGVRAMSQRKFSDKEKQWVKRNVKLENAELHRRWVKWSGRDEISVAQLVSLRHRNGWKCGRPQRYVKGHVPANKGKKAKHTEKSIAAFFKPGHVPANRKGPGYESISSDGYRQMIVDEPNPHTGANCRTVQKHRWLWIKKNGPVPEGHKLKCVDGDKLNCDPSNWIALPTGVIARMNGSYGRRNYNSAPAELKPTILLVSKLEQAVFDHNKGKSE